MCSLSVGTAGPLLPGTQSRTSLTVPWSHQSTLPETASGCSNRCHRLQTNFPESASRELLAFICARDAEADASLHTSISVDAHVHHRLYIPEGKTGRIGDF